MIGIYKITNNLNGSIYIGQSINIKKRFADHKSPRTLKRNHVLAKAFNKYGIQNFMFEVMETCEEISLDEREIFYIKTLEPRYNMNEGGVGNKGHRVSKEIKRNLSLRGKEQWERKTPEQRAKQILNNLTSHGPRYPISQETREKLRNYNLGKKQSAETIAKRMIGMSSKMMGNKNGNKKVAQIEPLTGEIIKIFESSRVAAEQNNISPSGITHTLKGQQLTCAGFKWIYV